MEYWVSALHEMPGNFHPLMQIDLLLSRLSFVPLISSQQKFPLPSLGRQKHPVHRLMDITFHYTCYRSILEAILMPEA